MKKLWLFLLVINYILWNLYTNDPVATLAPLVLIIPLSLLLYGSFGSFVYNPLYTLGEFSAAVVAILLSTFTVKLVVHESILYWISTSLSIFLGFFAYWIAFRQFRKV